MPDGDNMLSIKVSDKAVGVVFFLSHVERVCAGISNLESLTKSFLTLECGGELYIKKNKVMSNQDAENLIFCSQSIIREMVRAGENPMLLMLVESIANNKRNGADEIVIEMIKKTSAIQSLLTRFIGSVRSMGNIIIKYKDIDILDIVSESEFLMTKLISLKKQINLQYKSDLFEVEVSSFMRPSSGLPLINSFIDMVNKEKNSKNEDDSDFIICNNVYENGTVSFVVKGEECVKLLTRVIGRESIAVREISRFDAEYIDFNSRRAPLNKNFLDSFTHILAAIPILSPPPME